jgi:hypothetical protein
MHQTDSRATRAGSKRRGKAQGATSATEHNVASMKDLLSAVRHTGPEDEELDVAMDSSDPRAALTEVLKRAPMNNLLSAVKQTGVNEDELDEAMDSPDPRAALIRLLEQPRQYEARLTTAFSKLLSKIVAVGMKPKISVYQMDQALQMLRQDRGLIDPDVAVTFLSHTTPALLHATRVHLYAAGGDMHSAQSNISLALVLELLEQGADANARDYVCFTPLLYAAHAKSIRLSKLLVEYGARCDTSPYTLHVATYGEARTVFFTMGKFYETVRLGMTKLSNRTWWPGGFTRRVLVDFPVRDFNCEGFEFHEFGELLERATSGEELLHTHMQDARRGLQPWLGSLLDVLLKSNTCDIDRQDSNGHTALILAAQAGMHEIVQRLLEAGASTSVSDTEGLTSVHYAAKDGQPEVLELLIDASTAETLALETLHGGLTYMDMLASDSTVPRSWQRSPSTDHGGWGGRGAPEVKDQFMVDSCSIPEIDRTAFTGEIFAQHVSAQKPFIVRGLGNNWPMREAWRRKELLQKHGQLKFKTAAIGYAHLLGEHTYSIPAHLAKK